MSDPKTERFVAQVPGILAELERRAEALFGLQLAPQVEALPALEQIAAFLAQMRERFDDQDRRINILLLGTYLGEIVRRAGDGQWQVDTSLGVPLVHLPNGQVFDAMRTVQLRLDEDGPSLAGSNPQP